ncbi:MAG TPA: phosphoglycerate dehydrogenase [Tepidisphaeraceae bacterium]|jgi:D-3-phosphoglycerate dehydrogenase
MSAKWNVLLSAPYMLPFAGRFVPQLEAAGCRVVVPTVNERLEEAELLELTRDVDGTICGDDRYTRRVIAAAGRLKVISKWGTGIDSIDRAACEEYGVRVCNTPGAFTTPVADSVFAYLLAFARRTPWMDRHMKAGRWEKIPGRTLSECTLGVVGLGNIGREVARRAAVFGMTVLGTDVRPVDAAFTQATGTQVVSLDELLSRSDFVTLHTDLNAGSHHLMSVERLALMKRSAVLINTSRGPVVDEDALVRALWRDGIAGAALDVFEIEPLPEDSPLRVTPNVMLAPHNSNSSPAAWERVHVNSIRNLLEGLGEVRRDVARAA